MTQDEFDPITKCIEKNVLKNILLTLNRLCVDIKKLRMDCIKIRDIWAVSGCKLRSLLKQTTYSLTKKQTNNLLIL